MWLGGEEGKPRMALLACSCTCMSWRLSGGLSGLHRRSTTSQSLTESDALLHMSHTRLGFGVDPLRNRHPRELPLDVQALVRLAGSDDLTDSDHRADSDHITDAERLADALTRGCGTAGSET
eukprot:2340346-Rhodomonas_salina.1